jgi:hypothetical protein
MELPQLTWDVHANGVDGKLDPRVDPDGNLTGTITFGGGSDRIFGFWDKDANRIAFTRVQAQDQPEANQIYTGCSFEQPGPPIGNDAVTVVTLAGTFQGFVGAVNAQLNVLGWYATVSVIRPG